MLHHYVTELGVASYPSGPRYLNGPKVNGTAHVLNIYRPVTAGYFQFLTGANHDAYDRRVRLPISTGADQVLLELPVQLFLLGVMRPALGG